MRIQKIQNKNKLNNWIIILFLIIIILIGGTTLVAAPPTPQTVAGTIFNNDTSGAANGIPVKIFNMNISQEFYTQVYAPIPPKAGAYSASINGSIGDTIRVRAYNSSNYGESFGVLDKKTTNIDVTMNMTRPSETNITITAPNNDSSFNLTKLFNVSVNISVLGNNATNCNVTLTITNTSIVTTAPAANLTNNVGDINLGETKTTIFELKGIFDGSVNILAEGQCYSDGVNLENLNTDSLTNITIIDNIPPNITLVDPYDFEERGVGYIDFSYIPEDINLANCTLYYGDNISFLPIETSIFPTSNQTDTFFNHYFDIGLYLWNVQCWDTIGNTAFALANFTLNITRPDLTLNYSDIWFGNENKIEKNNITVFANITNVGLTNAYGTITIQFYDGDPDIDGVMFDTNKTIVNLSVSEQKTVNATYTLKPGPNNIFVLIDPNDVINESNENNNKNNNSLNVPLYQIFYGNVSTGLVLGTSNNMALFEFSNGTGFFGNIFFADADSSFSFADLQAIGRTINDDPAVNDFSEIDTGLNSSLFNDSIKNVWGNGTETPINTTTFNITSINISNVPIIKSTNSSSFITGILWDTADDLTVNLEYDNTDKEDLVFATKINPATIGAYGIVDYEIKIPALLKNYKQSLDKINFYVEIK